MPRPQPPLVLVTEPNCPELQTALEAEGWRVAFADSISASETGAVDGILHISGRPLSQGFLEQFENLKAISLIGNPITILPSDIVTGKRVHVYSIDQYDTDDCAEHALSLIYAAWLQLTEGQWLERDADWMEAHSLRGKKVGIVGLGAVGAAFAKRASALGLEVSWWGPRSKSAPWPRSDSLMALAERNDVLVVLCPNDATSRGLISDAVLQAIGSHGLLVSLAGGEVIDEAALVGALRAQRLSCAVLTVADHNGHIVDRLSRVPNLILTSQAASVTLESMVENTALAIGHLQKHFAIACHTPDHAASTTLQLDALKRAFVTKAEATDRAVATSRH